MPHVARMLLAYFCHTNNMCQLLRERLRKFLEGGILHIVSSMPWNTPRSIDLGNKFSDAIKQHYTTVIVNLLQMGASIL